MQSANHLVYTAKSRSQFDFPDDVANWLTDNGVTFHSREKFFVTTSKPITVDFVIEREEKIPAFMYALHAETKAWARNLVNGTIVNWLDLMDVKDLKFTKAALLDDSVEEEVWEDNYARLKKRTDFVGFWDERDELLEQIL
jgi:hypothetical protein